MPGAPHAGHDAGVTTSPSVLPAPGPADAPPAEALAYHRLARTRPGTRWWRPLLVGLVAAAFYVALLVIGTVLVVLPAVAAGEDGFAVLERIGDEDLTDPVTFVVAMLSIVAMLPAVLAATRLLGARPVGLLWSVAARPRWGWAARCLAAAATVQLLVAAGDAGVAALSGRAWEPHVDTTSWVLLGLMVLVVPAQCVAEEVVFRGYLMQTVGTWLRHPAFAVVLPVPLFVLGHAYVGLAMLDTAVWALAMGWLAWRTGGLEAPAAVHVVNNVVVFSLGAVDLADLSAVDMGPVPLAVSTATTLVTVGVIEVMARRSDVRRARPAVAVAGPIG